MTNTEKPDSQPNKRYNWQISQEQSNRQDSGERYCGKRVLEALSREEWRSAREIVELANCNISTARKHLNEFIRRRVVVRKRAHDGNLILLYKINTEE